MVYPQINGTSMSTDVMEIFRYSNLVTFNLAGTFIVAAFFLVALFGTMFSQQKVTGRMNFPVSCLAASFLSLIFATLIEQTSGILSPATFFILIGATIFSFIWVAMSQE
jgi:hypothetical protein